MVKRCAYALCNSDSRYGPSGKRPRADMEGVVFFPIPGSKTCQERRRRWIKNCGRQDFEPDTVGRGHFVCSKHFVEGKPTTMFPDPIPCQASPTELADFLRQRGRKVPSTKVITLKCFQSGGSMYVIPKSQAGSGTAAPASLPSMHPASNYTSGHVRMAAPPISASNMATSNMAAASKMAASGPGGYPHVNFAFKVPEQGQPNLYPTSVVQQGHAPLQVQIARHASQSPQLAAQSPHHMTSPSPHHIIGSSHMTSHSPHMTSHSPRITSHSPQISAASHSPRLTSHSPHMTPHSPHMTSHSPHITSHSPRLTSHSPHMTQHSPHMAPNSSNMPLHSQHVIHGRGVSRDLHEYRRPLERTDPTAAPLDLTTPKSAMGSDTASSADSPLDLSVKASRKRDHDDDVIVVGEQHIPFKARRLPEPEYTYHPLLGPQSRAHGALQPGTPGNGGHYLLPPRETNNTSTPMVHPAPYYYAPGGHHRHPVYHRTAAGTTGVTSRTPHGTSAKVVGHTYHPHSPYGYGTPPSAVRGADGASRSPAAPPTTISASHINGVSQTYPYTVTGGSSNSRGGAVHLPHHPTSMSAVSTANSTGGSVRYVYPTTSSSSSIPGPSSGCASNVPSPHHQPPTPGATIRVPMQHRPSQENRQHPYPTTSPSLHRTPHEHLPPGPGGSGSSTTSSNGQTLHSNPSLVRPSAGVIQHVGANPMYEARSRMVGPGDKHLYTSSAGGEASQSGHVVIRTAGNREHPPSDHQGGYNQQHQQHVTPSHLGHAQHPHLSQQGIGHQLTNYSVGTSLPSRALAPQPSPENSGGGRSPYLGTYHKDQTPTGSLGMHASLPSHMVRPGQAGHNTSGGSSTGQQQTVRIQPFLQQVADPSTTVVRLPSHPTTYAHHHQHQHHQLATTSTSTTTTTSVSLVTTPSSVGYIQVPGGSQLSTAYLQHTDYRPLTTTTTTTNSMGPHHMYSTPLRTPTRPWGSDPMQQGSRPPDGHHHHGHHGHHPYDLMAPSIKKIPVANVNPIIVQPRSSPSQHPLHHKKQMLHQSRLESGPGCRESSRGTPPEGGQHTSQVNSGGSDKTDTKDQTGHSPNMVSSLVSEARLSTFKHMLPPGDHLSHLTGIKGEGGEPRPGDMLDFSKLSRGLDNMHPEVLHVKAEQEQFKPSSEHLSSPTELKIPMVPLKERMKPKDHFGRASPLCTDDAKIKRGPGGGRVNNMNSKTQTKAKSKLKTPENAKIHKYYSVKAKPGARRVKKDLSDCKGTKKSVDDGEGARTGEKGESVSLTTTGEKPRKRQYRRKTKPDGFTKQTGRGGRRMLVTDENDVSRKSQENDVKPKRKPRTTKQPAARRRRRGQDASNVVLAMRTRTQTAATKGVRRLSSSCYNKNAAYERELKREEYRKIIKRFKRQNRQRCSRDGTRVTRERLGVVFQSDTGSEEENEAEEEEEVTRVRRPRAAPLPVKRVKRAYRRKAKPEVNGDDLPQEQRVTPKVRRSKGAARGRAPTRGGFTTKGSRHPDDDNVDDVSDVDYRPTESRPHFEDDDDGDNNDVDDHDDVDPEVDYDSGVCEAAAAARHPAPSPRRVVCRRAGRGRGGRYFRRRTTGAWYDKRRDKKKRKPLPVREKVEREAIEDRAVDDCAGQEVLPAPEMARRLVICKDTGETLLHKAARLGLDDVVGYCLESAFDVNSRDNAGYTPLHETCVRGHVMAARMLIAHGADINANAHDGTRPMHDAVDNNNVEIVRLLLTCGVDTKLVSFGTRDVMKLAKGDTMRQLLRGYFGDLNGQNEEKGHEEIPWAFASSGALEAGPPRGYDLFTDLPPDPDHAEGYVEFDFCDTPHLPTYFLDIVPTKGPANYHLLDDVLSQLGCSKAFFVTSHPEVEIVVYDGKVLPVLPIRRQPLPSTSSMTSSCAGDVSHASADGVSLVEVTDVVRCIVGVETEWVTSLKDVKKVNVVESADVNEAAKDELKPAEHDVTASTSSRAECDMEEPPSVTSQKKVDLPTKGDGAALASPAQGVSPVVNDVTPSASDVTKADCVVPPTKDFAVSSTSCVSVPENDISPTKDYVTSIKSDVSPTKSDNTQTQIDTAQLKVHTTPAKRDIEHKVTAPTETKTEIAATKTDALICDVRSSCDMSQTSELAPITSVCSSEKTSKVPLVNNTLPAECSKPLKPLHQSEKVGELLPLAARSTASLTDGNVPNVTSYASSDTRAKASVITSLPKSATSLMKPYVKIHKTQVRISSVASNEKTAPPPEPQEGPKKAQRSRTPLEGPKKEQEGRASLEVPKTEREDRTSVEGPKKEQEDRTAEGPQKEQEDRTTLESPKKEQEDRTILKVPKKEQEDRTTLKFPKKEQEDRTILKFPKKEQEDGNPLNVPKKEQDVGTPLKVPKKEQEDGTPMKVPKKEQEDGTTLKVLKKEQEDRTPLEGQNKEQEDGTSSECPKKEQEDRTSMEGLKKEQQDGTSMEGPKKEQESRTPLEVPKKEHKGRTPSEGPKKEQEGRIPLEVQKKEQEGRTPLEVPKKEQEVWSPSQGPKKGLEDMNPSEAAKTLPVPSPKNQETSGKRTQVQKLDVDSSKPLPKLDTVTANARDKPRPSKHEAKREAKYSPLIPIDLPSVAKIGIEQRIGEKGWPHLTVPSSSEKTESYALPYRPCVVDVVAAEKSEKYRLDMPPSFSGVGFVSDISIDSLTSIQAEVNGETDSGDKCTTKDGPVGKEWECNGKGFVITPTSGSQEGQVQTQITSKTVTDSCSDSNANDSKLDSGCKTECHQRSGISEGKEQGERVTDGEGGSLKVDLEMLTTNATNNDKTNCDVHQIVEKATNSGDELRTKDRSTLKNLVPGEDSKPGVMPSGKPQQQDKQQEVLSETEVTVASQPALVPSTDGSSGCDVRDMKIADAPGSCLKQLAHKRQSGEERSISPKAAETMPAAADDIPATCDGAVTSSSGHTPPGGDGDNDKKDNAPPSGDGRKESNNNITEEVPDTPLPVLEKHERGEGEEPPVQDKTTAEPAAEDTTEDREMPQLTIQAY